MKVMLINPPWYIFQGSSFPEIPLGLSYLASFLKSKGHQVKVFNADFLSSTKSSDKSIFNHYSAYLSRLRNIRDPIWQRVEKEIRDFYPQVVGITLKTGSFVSGCMVANITKGISPEIITVAGGPHATLLPEEVLQEGTFDYVIRGEGEITFAELLEKLEKGEEGKELRGISALKNGKVIHNPDRTFIENLDNLPFPERDDHIPSYSPEGLGLIMTGRGCPYACTFCASDKIWKRKVRFRSPENVIQEILFLYRRYGVTHLKFRDDTFTLKKDRVLDICDRIISTGIPITWQCDTRADCIDEEIARKMRQAGCIGASIGVETGSERLLRYIQKGETKESIKRGIRILRKYRINVAIFLMIGFPGETEEEIKETLEFARELSPHHMVLSILTPYPGTKIFQEAIKEGLLSPEKKRWESWFHQSPDMGLFQDREKFRELARWVFEEVEKYNTAFIRKWENLISRMNFRLLKTRLSRVFILRPG